MRLFLGFVTPKYGNFILMMAMASVFASLSFAQSLPTDCIQEPSRTSVCPRLIYKSAELPHPQTRQLETRIVCICLADFDDLLLPANNDVEQKMKEMRMKSLTAQLQITEEQLLDLVKY